MFTYVLTTQVGQMRLLIPDRVQADAIFLDEELQVFLTLEASDVRRATALALETIASDQALLLKVITLPDFASDGAKLATELRTRATALRTQAAQSEADAGSAFDWAEQVVDVFSARERIEKESQRG